MHILKHKSSRRGRDRMIVRSTTTYAVSDLRQIGGFLRVLQFHLPIKLSATI